MISLVISWSTEKMPNFLLIVPTSQMWKYSALFMLFDSKRNICGGFDCWLEKTRYSVCEDITSILTYVTFMHILTVFWHFIDHSIYFFAIFPLWFIFMIYLFINYVDLIHFFLFHFCYCLFFTLTWGEVHYLSLWLLDPSWHISYFFFNIQILI